MTTRPEDRIRELFDAHTAAIGEGWPSYINEARESYMRAFEDQGLPTGRDERYRHFDLRGIFAGEWNYASTPSAAPGKLPVDGYGMHITDGILTGGGLARLGNGVVYGSLRQAAADMKEIVGRCYNSIADNDGEASTALNSAFTRDGAFIYVPKGVDADKPFVVSATYNGPASFSFARLLIVAEEGAKLDVLVSHTTAGGRVMANFVRETVLAKGAQADISEITRLGKDDVLVCGNYIKQAAGTKSNTMNVWFGGGSTRVNAHTDLEGAGGNSEHYGLFLCSGGELADVNVAMNHLVPDCESSQLIKGVVSGEAVGAFTGRIYVAKDAQRTNAFQQSRNLQLSDTSRIYTEPQLEIYADDVKCSHGATVGQMDDEAVYYMRQRGLSEQEARKLQLFGFVNDIVTRCPGGQICDHIAGMAQKRINQL